MNKKKAIDKDTWIYFNENAKVLPIIVVAAEELTLVRDFGRWLIKIIKRYKPPLVTRIVSVNFKRSL